MKITNKDLIEILLGEGIDPNLLVNSLSIIGKLIKKYGKTVFADKYIKEISNIDNNIGKLIAILDFTNKIQYQDTKDLIRTTKSLADNYRKEFVVMSNSKKHNDEIKSYLIKKFKDADIDSKVTSDTDSLGVSIAGEGRYFKKNLDSDLEKLLK